MGDYLLEPSDQITGILSYDLCCDGKAAKYWIIGSEVLHEISSSGRLSVCALQQGGIISLVASVILPGAVAAVAGIDGKIAVVAGAEVSLHNLLSVGEVDDFRPGRHFRAHKSRARARATPNTAKQMGARISHKPNRRAGRHYSHV